MTKNATMSVTYAHGEDAAAVVSWLENRVDVVAWAGEAVPDPLDVEWLVQEIGKPNPQHYALKDNDGNIAGLFALISYPDEQRLHLTRVIVAPTNRGAGLGKRIVAECQRLLRESTANLLTLHVFVSNQRAFTLYEQTGFQRIAEPLTPPNAPDPLIRMEYRS